MSDLDLRTASLKAVDVAENVIVHTIVQAESIFAGLFGGDGPQVPEREARNYDEPQRLMEPGEELTGEIVSLVEYDGRPYYALACENGPGNVLVPVGDTAYEKGDEITATNTGHGVEISESHDYGR